MSKEKVSNYTIVKGLFPNTPATWDARINLESQEYWNTAKVVIASDDFQPLRNEIFDALINRIGLVKVRERSFLNPLNMFKMGFMNYGDSIQEIATDVVDAKQFKTGYSNQFETEEANVKAAYHRINRQEFYKITVDDSILARAFINEYGLQALINQIVNTLYNSNTIDEFIFTKKLINDFFKNTDYPVRDEQIIDVPHISSRNRTDKALKFFLEDVKTAIRMMGFPTRQYNPARQMNQIAADDVVLVLNAKITSINEVHNLASAFNPEYMDLNIPIISVDKISDNESIIGVILSKKSLDIRNTKELVRVAENAQSLYTNYFYHIHQIYTMSPFENIAYIREADK